MKNESKYFNTALKMDKVFLEILEKKELPYITVKEICEKAGVNRSTFYLHYETIRDLLAESVEYMTKQFLSQMGQSRESFASHIRNCSKDELYLVTPEYLMPYLAYIKEHKRLFRMALDNAKVLRLDESYDKMFRFVFTPILERYQVPVQDRSYMMSFYISGLMAIIAEWLKNDCVDTMEHIISVIQVCAAPRHNGKEDL